MTVLILIALLQIKHLFADYFLQTSFMLGGRAKYLHTGRAAHAGVHALGTLIAFLLVGAGLWVAICLALLDMVIHFHIDWAKARYSDGKGLTTEQAAYWRAAGLDQAAHHLTYLGLAALWVSL